MTINNKVKVCMKTVVMILALTVSLVAGSSANEPSANASNTASAEKRELDCRVEGNYIKHVLVTNRTDRVIAKGTPVRLDGSTGIETTARMPKNLKPGRTAIVYSGALKVGNCQCRINQQ